MANADVVKGLLPAYHLNGSPYNGQVEEFYVPSTDATAIFVGDPVKLAGSADTDGIPSVAQAAVNDVVIGVMVGRARVTRDDELHRPASTEAWIQVCTDPSVVYEIQEDSVGGALAVANVGQNASWIVGSGSATTGLSGVELDSSTAAVTATLDLQILRLVRRADNEIGANAKWYVRLNNHQYVDGTTGI